MKHKRADLIMAYAVEAQTSETPWDIFEYQPMLTKDWRGCEYAPGWSGSIEYRLKPKTRVIDWSKVNYDVVPVKLLSVGGAFYAAEGHTYPAITLVTGKKIAWQGGECPLPEGVMVTVWDRESDVYVGCVVSSMEWEHCDVESDIIWFEVTGLAEGYSWG